MGHYRCVLAVSWVIFTLAGAMVTVSMFLPYWVQLDQATEHFAGPNFQGNSTDFLLPTWCTLAISSFLAWTCSVLLLVLACTDWCCHVTSCMRVVPKITMVLGTLSGALAITGCVLILLDTYVNRPLTSATDVYPGYCFYMTLSGAIFLLMAGCLVLHAKRRNKVMPEKPAPSSRDEAVDSPAYTVMPAYIPEQYFANPHNPIYTSQPVHTSTMSHSGVTKRGKSKSSHASTQTLLNPQHSSKTTVTMATQTLKNPNKKQPSLTTSTQTKAAKIKVASAQTMFNMKDDQIIVSSPPLLTVEETMAELYKPASVESPYY